VTSLDIQEGLRSMGSVTEVMKIQIILTNNFIRINSY